MDNLAWKKHNDGTYHAAKSNHEYTIILEPRPVDRYIVFVDGTVERAVSGAQTGQRLLFWYLKDAKRHCQELVNGATQCSQSVGRMVPVTSTSIHPAVPFPNKDQVIAAVRAVTSGDGRAWPIVDQAWEILGTSDPLPSGQALTTLERYVSEIAKWGSLRRWLTGNDLPSAAHALWDVRGQVLALRGRGYSENGIADEVIYLYENLIAKMCDHGVAKTHYSWASKIRTGSCQPAHPYMIVSFCKSCRSVYRGRTGIAKSSPGSTNARPILSLFRKRLSVKYRK